MTDWPVSKEAQSLHRDALVWDNVFPFPNTWLMSWLLPGETIGGFEPKYQQLQRYGQSGANVVGLTISGDDSNLPVTMRVIAKELSFIRANSDDYLLIETVDDIELAQQSGRIGLIFNFQGIDPLERSTEFVEIYHRLGVRQMLIAYNRQNHAGAGCHEPVDSGLSAFGKDLIGEMNRCGVIVDCSHTGFKTTMDTMAASSDPVVFSHSNTKALNPHDRNITDEQAKACAETGGVVGIVGFDGFLRGNDLTVDTLTEQVDYYCELIGPQHVGLGLDWMFWEDFRDFVAAAAGRYKPGQYESKMDFAEPEYLPRITEALLNRGYAEADIRGILGENWLRVASQVWKS